MIWPFVSTSYEVFRRDRQVSNMFCCCCCCCRCRRHVDRTGKNDRGRHHTRWPDAMLRGLVRHRGPRKVVSVPCQSQSGAQCPMVRFSFAACQLVSWVHEDQQPGNEEQSPQYIPMHVYTHPCSTWVAPKVWVTSQRLPKAATTQKRHLTIDILVSLA